MDLPVYQQAIAVVIGLAFFAMGVCWDDVGGWIKACIKFVYRPVKAEGLSIKREQEKTV